MRPHAGGVVLSALLWSETHLIYRLDTPPPQGRESVEGKGGLMRCDSSLKAGEGQKKEKGMRRAEAPWPAEGI